MNKKKNTNNDFNYRGRSYYTDNNKRKRGRQNRGFQVPWLLIIIVAVIILVFCGFQVKDYVKEKEYRNLGVEKFLKEDYQGAATDFKKALTNTNVFGLFLTKDIKYYLAETYFQQENYKEALNIYEQLAVRDKKNSTILCYEGASLAKMGKTDEAIAKFQKAKSMGNEESLHYLSKLYYDLEEYKKAITYEEKYIKNNPTQGISYIILAKGYAENKEFDKALKAIKTGLKLKDDSANQELLFQEVVVYEKKLDFEKAYDKCKAYVKRYPDDEAAKLELEFLETR